MYRNVATNRIIRVGGPTWKYLAQSGGAHTNMNPHEILIYKLAAEHDIAPPIINSDSISITAETMPYTLAQYVATYGINKLLRLKIIAKLQHLHSLGIYHGDIHEENIMIGDNGEPYIIDYGLSKMIGEITEKDLNDHMYMVDGDETANNVDELLQMELNELESLLM